jgi:hypothetical protein
MPNIDTAFPSKYLRAADLNGAEPNLTISNVTSETVGDDQKLVVYFEGKQKGLVLNKTNANAIADIARDRNTDNWTGCRIKLVTARVDYQGKRVDAVRVDLADAPGAAPARRATPPPPPEDINDDSIPF